MAAELFDGSSFGGRLHTWLENGFSRFVLIKSFLAGDAERAAHMGITFGLDSYGHADFVTDPHRYKVAAPATS